MVTRMSKAVVAWSSGKGVDPCGENGEMHTLVVDGPMLREPLAVDRGEVVLRDGFVFADVLPR